MTDIFRHVTHSSTLNQNNEIFEISQEFGVESSCTYIDSRVEKTCQENSLLISILGKLDDSLESVSLTTAEMSVLYGDGFAVSVEDVTNRGYSLKPRDIFNRIRENWATGFIEPFDQIGDLFRSEKSSIRKYNEKVRKSEKLIKGKTVSLTETDQTGALGTLIEYFRNELGVVENITDMINKDIEMVRFVLNTYPDQLMTQLERMAQKGQVGEDDYKHYEHPVALFPEEWLNNKLFLRDTGFVVKGDFNKRLGGWEGLAQYAHVAYQLGGYQKFRKVLHATSLFLSFSANVKGLTKLGESILAKDVQFTTSDIFKTIQQFNEYSNILDEYEKGLKSTRRQAEGFVSKVQGMDFGDKDTVADMIAYSSIVLKSTTTPSKDILGRSIRVMRAMAYLINRMAKFAK